MRKRFGQRIEKGDSDPDARDLAPLSSTRPRGGNLVIEVAQWLVTTITLGQAVWRWLGRPKSEASRPQAIPEQGKTP